MKIKIFSVYYGENKKIISNQYIYPIQAGASIIDNDLIDLKDSRYSEISLKNKYYNELSAIYTVWKDFTTELDYIGICHYRRYFTSIIDKILIVLSKIFKNIDIETIIYGTTFKLISKMKNYDILLPKVKKINKNVKDYYLEKHIGEHYIIMEEVIKEHFEFLYETFLETSNMKIAYFLNMFILRREIFDDYCKNLFEFLCLIEEKIKIPNDMYQDRALGFLGERFFNLYFHYIKNNKNYDILEMPIIKI